MDLPPVGHNDWQMVLLRDYIVFLHLVHMIRAMIRVVLLLCPIRCELRNETIHFAACPQR